MNFEILLAAFGGGVFGTLLGATGAFIMVGFTGLVGVGLMVATGDSSILTNISFGPFFGPHVAFAGGVAAAAYAGNKKDHITSGEDCCTPLAFTQDPIVFLIGGLFGVFGFLLNQFIASFARIDSIPGLIDSVALTVAVLGIIGRLIFGNGLLGDKKLAAEDKVGRYAILPAAFISQLMIAVVLGAVVGVTAIALKVPEVGFVISAASLIFLYTNPGNGPVTHHLTITSGIAALQTGSIYWGIAASVMAFLLFEFLGVRTLNKYQNTHVDPPAVAIAITSFFVLNFFPRM